MSDLYSAINEDNQSENGVSKRIQVLRAIKDNTSDSSKCLKEISEKANIQRETVRSHAQDMESEGLVSIDSEGKQDFTYIEIKRKGLNYLNSIEWVLDDEGDNERKTQKLRLMLMSQIKYELEEFEDYEKLFPLNSYPEKTERLGGKELNKERRREQLQRFQFGEITDNLSREDIHEFEERQEELHGDGHVEYKIIGVLIPQPYRKRFSGSDGDNYFKYKTPPMTNSIEITFWDGLRLWIKAKLPWVNGMERVV